MTIKVQFNIFSLTYKLIEFYEENKKGVVASLCVKDGRSLSVKKHIKDLTEVALLTSRRRF